jgi:hypothetical protein
MDARIAQTRACSRLSPPLPSSLAGVPATGADRNPLHAEAAQRSPVHAVGSEGPTALSRRHSSSTAGRFGDSETAQSAGARQRGLPISNRVAVPHSGCIPQ